MALKPLSAEKLDSDHPLVAFVELDAALNASPDALVEALLNVAETGTKIDTGVRSCVATENTATVSEPWLLTSTWNWPLAFGSTTNALGTRGVPDWACNTDVTTKRSPLGCSTFTAPLPTATTTWSSAIARAANTGSAEKTIDAPLQGLLKSNRTSALSKLDFGISRLAITCGFLARTARYRVAADLDNPKS